MCWSYVQSPTNGKMCRIHLQNTAWGRMVPKGTKRCWLVPNGVKWWWMVPNGTEVLVKSDMRRRNCFWLNQRVLDTSGYAREVLDGPIELWIRFEKNFFQKSTKIAKEKKFPYPPPCLAAGCRLKPDSDQISFYLSHFQLSWIRFLRK